VTPSVLLDRRSSPPRGREAAGIPPTATQQPTRTGELKELLTRTARGDRDAFETLYVETAPKLFGILARILGQGDLANTVLEDVYMRIWQEAGTFNPEIGPPITWMAALARNRALDEVARGRLERTIEDSPEAWEPPIERDAEPDPEQKERGRLLGGLQGLEPERRRMLLRAYYYGLSREEIALEANRSAASVKPWLRSVLAQLKGCLSQ
jgi:RNA polymerase sigma-70 factor (ECF subfamily)